MRTVELHLDGLAIANRVLEDENRKQAEKLGLDGTVERTSTVDRRIANGSEVLLRLRGDGEPHLAVRKTLLHFLQVDVDDLRHVLARKCAL